LARVIEFGIETADMRVQEVVVTKFQVEQRTGKKEEENAVK